MNPTILKTVVAAFLVWSLCLAGFGVSSALAQTSSPPAGVDLSGIEVCGLIPQDEVAAIVGPIKTAKKTTTIDRETGCHYRNNKGQFFDITYLPLDQWGLAKVTMKKPQPLENVGDGGFEAQYSDALMLKILSQDRAVIEVRASDDNKDTALALYRLGLKYLPEK